MAVDNMDNQDQSLGLEEKETKNIQPKKTKFSVWLLKEGVTEDQLFGNETLMSVDIPGLGKIYKSQVPIDTPKWVESFFRNQIGDLKKGGAGAILKTEVKVGGASRQFLISFGYGFHKISQSVCEGRFGLKVVLNAGDLKNGVRSIDKRNLSAAPRLSREQASKHEDMSSFGIDYEQDMINALTLASLDKRLGSSISGGTSLSVTTSHTIDNIKDLLPTLYDYYIADNYIKQGYEWVDHINDAPKKYIAVLDLKLVDLINDYDLDNENCYFSPPEIDDYTDIIGFAPSSTEMDLLKDEIVLDDYRTKRNGSKFEDVDSIKRRQVHVWSAAADSPIRHWSLYRCINVQVVYDGYVFILSNGKWYMVNKVFSSNIDEWYKGLEIIDAGFPLYKKIAYEEDGVKKTKHSEEDFNKSVANDGTIICLDKKLVDIGPRKDIEACDLYRQNEFIHIKIFTGASAPISHLLAQATVSAELFLGERLFREELNQKLSEVMKLSSGEIDMPTGTKYTVSLGVITNKDSLSLPFFSKINLRSTIQRLKQMGLKVQILMVKGDF